MIKKDRKEFERKKERKKERKIGKWKEKEIGIRKRGSKGDHSTVESKKKKTHE